MAEQDPLVSELKPHQARVVRRLKDQPGLVVAHRVGAGKTLTAIAAAVDNPGEVRTVVPAALRENFKKEIMKHVRNPSSVNKRNRLESLQRIARAYEDEPIEKMDLLIVDEAHKARDPSTKTHKAIKALSEKADKKLLLTATPLYNHPADLSGLVNLAAGDRVLPTTPVEFEKQFIETTLEFPGLYATLMHGAMPGERKSLKNTDTLREHLGKWVDWYSGSKEGFPDRTDVTIDVPMTSKQYDVYEGLIETNPALAYKVRKNLPPSKSESRQLNAFAGAIRQVSNTPQSYVKDMSQEEALENAPKLQEAARRLMAEIDTNPDHRAVVYSNYLSSGLDLYSKILDDNQISHAVFKGGLKDRERKDIVNRYNNGELKALLVSTAGGEGLDLKGTRQVQILEPHWNEAKIEQVIGRGSRYRSHAHLPEDQQNIRIEHYNAIPAKRTGLGKFLLGEQPTDTTIDPYLRNLSKEKSFLMHKIEDLLAEETAKHDLKG